MSDLRDRVDHWLGDPRAGVYADRSNGPLLEDVIGWTDSKVPPGEPLPVYPMQPMIGFLAGRETVAGYHVIWPYQAGERDRRIVAALDDQGVDHIVFSLSQWGHLQPFQENAPALFDALVERWQIDQVFSREWNGPIVVTLRRRKPQGNRTPVREVADVSGASWSRWPFDDVLRQSPGTAADPAPARLEITVPADRPILTTAFGMDPDRWYGPPTGPFTFEAFLESPPGSTPQSLLRRVIDPRAKVEDRHWFPVFFDLSAEAGNPIALVLTVTAEALPEGSTDLVGWRSPALAPKAQPRRYDPRPTNPSLSFQRRAASPRSRAALDGAARRQSAK
jgi:hypothetical protein